MFKTERKDLYIRLTAMVLHDNHWYYSFRAITTNDSPFRTDARKSRWQCKAYSQTLGNITAQLHSNCYGKAHGCNNIKVIPLSACWRTLQYEYRPSGYKFYFIKIKRPLDRFILLMDNYMAVETACWYRNSPCFVDAVCKIPTSRFYIGEIIVNIYFHVSKFVNDIAKVVKK